MNTPHTAEQSDLSLWPDMIDLIDCNGGVHRVKGRLSRLPEAGGDITGIIRTGGAQVHCDAADTPHAIKKVRIDGVEHQVVDQERRTAVFDHMRLSIQRF